MATRIIGIPKNTRRTSVSGATCSHDTLCGLIFIVSAGGSWRETRRASASPRRLRTKSGGNELVPPLHHVTILVHDGVPAGDVPHPLPEAAAVAGTARFLHQVPVRILDVLRRRLALIPVIPLIAGEMRFRRFGHRAVVTLLGNEAALPARIVPVEIFDRGVELEAAQMGHRGDATAPAA